MAEFSFVLSVKRMQEWNNIEEHCKQDCAKSEKIPIHNANEVSDDSFNVDSETTKVRSVSETTDQYTSIWSRKCSKLHGSPLTTKIDFAAFILFHCSFMIFNFIYWVPVLDDYYQTD